MTATKRKLLREGAPSILDASLAIREFRTAVQAEVIRVVAPRLARLGHAIGLPLKQQHLNAAIDPEDNDSWDGIYLSIGATLQLPKYGEAYFRLHWTRDGANKPVVESWAVIYLERKRKRDRARELVEAAEKAMYWDPNHGMILRKRLAWKQVPHFAAALGTLIDQWTSVWRKVGGLKKV